MRNDMQFSLNYGVRTFTYKLISVKGSEQ